jgi:hypothetical protein
MYILHTFVEIQILVSCTIYRAYSIFVQYTYKHEEDVWGAIQIFFNTFHNTMSNNL